VRYAIYYVPEAGTPLAEFGSNWLSRDVEDGRALPQPRLPGIPPETLAAWTAEPRRYGFHATLKAPFALATGATEASFLAAVRSLATGIARVRGPALVLREIDGFLALVPGGPAPEIDALAARCVQDLDAFRKPPSEAELKKRLAGGLRDREKALLQRWGYPYVLDAFRFHMTLTGRLTPDEQAVIRPPLAARLAPLGEIALEIADLAVCAEPTLGAPFTVRARFRLGAPASPGEAVQQR
jgi:putative phosphonate metabolism protein